VGCVGEHAVDAGLLLAGWLRLPGGRRHCSRR
jgi:hypothetical protein